MLFLLFEQSDRLILKEYWIKKIWHIFDILMNSSNPFHWLIKRWTGSCLPMYEKQQKYSSNNILKLYFKIFVVSKNLELAITFLLLSFLNVLFISIYRYLYNENIDLPSVMTALTTLYAAHKYMCPGLAKEVIITTNIAKILVEDNIWYKMIIQKIISW